MHIYTLLFLCCFAAYTQAQTIPLYHTLDSVKTAQKHYQGTLTSQYPDSHIQDSVIDVERDVCDSIRDMAHDYADSVIDHMDHSSHIELGVDIGTSQYYYGRRGPAAGATGAPSLKYTNKTGLYAMFGADIYDIKYSLVKPGRLLKQDTVSGQKIEPDLVFTAGWARTFYDKWDVELFYDHTFIFYGTDKELLSNTLDFNMDFDFWNYITAGVVYEFLFGGASADPTARKLSNVLTFDLYKDFKIYRAPGPFIFSIGPEILSNVGNDNLVRSRVIARNRHGGLDVPQVYDNFFGLLDAEAAINFDYRFKNLDINFSPHIALPFNEIPTNLPVDATAASLAQYRQNQTSPVVFYATMGIKYYFRFWKEQGKHKYR